MEVCKCIIKFECTRWLLNCKYIILHAVTFSSWQYALYYSLLSPQFVSSCTACTCSSKQHVGVLTFQSASSASPDTSYSTPQGQSSRDQRMTGWTGGSWRSRHKSTYCSRHTSSWRPLSSRSRNLQQMKNNDVTCTCQTSWVTSPSPWLERMRARDDTGRTVLL